MDSGLLQRSLGLPLGQRRRPEPIWGGLASEVLVRKLQLEHSLPAQQEPQGGGPAGTSTAINDVSWDCSGSFLASAGDDCALHVYSATGSLLRSFDPVCASAPRRRAALRCAFRALGPCDAPQHMLWLGGRGHCRFHMPASHQTLQVLTTPAFKRSSPHPPRPQGHTSSIMALQYLPGSRGGTLLTGGSDKQVRWQQAAPAAGRASSRRRWQQHIGAALRTGPPETRLCFCVNGEPAPGAWQQHAAVHPGLRR